MELDPGCLKVTVPPAPMLNEDQLRMAELEVWLTVRLLLVATAVAAPPVTNFAGPPEPQAPVAQGTGSAGFLALATVAPRAAPIAKTTTRIGRNCCSGLRIIDLVVPNAPRCKHIEITLP